MKRIFLIDNLGIYENKLYDSVNTFLSSYLMQLQLVSWCTYNPFSWCTYVCWVDTLMSTSLMYLRLWGKENISSGCTYVCGVDTLTSTELMHWCLWGKKNILSWCTSNLNIFWRWNAWMWVDDCLCLNKCSWCSSYFSKNELMILLLEKITVDVRPASKIINDFIPACHMIFFLLIKYWLMVLRLPYIWCSSFLRSWCTYGPPMKVRLQST